MDLYDLAKPVRTATIAEVERVLGPDADPSVREAHHLGVHLASLLIAWSAERFKAGTVVSDDVQDVFAVAASHALAYISANFRPMVGGRPITPSQSGQAFIQKAALHLFNQLAQIENGNIDFSVPFVRQEDGSIEPQEFDFRNLMKGT